jgi:hypothetical protein
MAKLLRSCNLLVAHEESKRPHLVDVAQKCTKVSLAFESIQERCLVASFHQCHRDCESPNMISSSECASNNIIHIRLGINTLCELIDLHSLFSHLCITQEIKRHPHQVTFDLVQLFTNFFNREIPSEQVALLVFGILLGVRLEVFVILECFDYNS